MEAEKTFVVVQKKGTGEKKALGSFRLCFPMTTARAAALKLTVTCPLCRTKMRLKALRYNHVCGRSRKDCLEEDLESAREKLLDEAHIALAEGFLMTSPDHMPPAIIAGLAAPGQSPLRPTRDGLQEDSGLFSGSDVAQASADDSGE